MSTARTRAAGPLGGPLAGLLAGVLLAAALSACGAGDPPVTTARSAGAPSATGSTPTAPTTGGAGMRDLPDVSGVPVPPDLDRAFNALLHQRAAALIARDRGAFDGGLDPSDASFTTAQDGYFDNLRQLPLQRLAYRLEPASLVRTGDSYWVVVDVTLQLAGFDAVPVTTPDRFRFTPLDGGAGSGRSAGFALSSTTDSAWEAANHLVGQPWDVEPIEVRSAPGVLGIFDAASVGRAGPLVRSFSRGVADVAAQVPYAWSRSVVFYALSDDRVLTSLVPQPDGVHGGDPALLDGVAFTVPRSRRDPTPASTRVVLNPSVPAADATTRDRLVRHELTHVAVGAHDDGAPVWLSEGLAEWVSVQPMDRADQQVPPSALTLAETKPVTMPPDTDFDGADAAAHYALAWWTCEYLAATDGPSAPWALLDAVTAPGARPRAATEAVAGLSIDGLARHGAQLLARVYDPAPVVSPPPLEEAPTTAPSAGAPSTQATETPSD